MGTHPIFESDFDCLTECLKIAEIANKIAKIKLKNFSKERLDPR